MTPQFLHRPMGQPRQQLARLACYGALLFAVLALQLPQAQAVQEELRGADWCLGLTEGLDASGDDSPCGPTSAPTPLFMLAVEGPAKAMPVGIRRRTLSALAPQSPRAPPL